MNTEQKHTLLPCPFCGEAEGLIIQYCEGTIIHPALRIYCDNCGASSGYSDRVDPVENWNRRAALQHSCKETSQDAERYRFIRSKVYASNAYGRASWKFHYDNLPLPLDNPTKGSVKQHFEDAIDHAMSVEEEGNKC